jgi:peptidoglycan hydrolase-like protein with peptidoglycan-binding domain
MRKIFLTMAAVMLLLPISSFAAFNKNLSYGSWGSDVINLQQFLSAQGDFNGSTTAVFGSSTRYALITFQGQHLIYPASGFFGPVTRKLVNGIIAKSVASTTAIIQPPVLQTNTSTPDSSWPALESKYFAQATQNGWTSLIITNAAGEKHYYRLENGVWVQKDTLAEAQQPYQPPLPPANASQIAEIGFLCSYATSQGNTATMQNCADGLILNGYNTNAIFRQNIDTIYNNLQQQLAQQQAASDQKLNCMKSLAKPYDPTISSAANIYNSETDMYLCGLGSMPPAPADPSPLPQLQSQLQQLQNTIQQNNSLLQLQQQIQQQTVPAQTHCAIEAGVWQCGLPGFE